jgi:hypothetical protein
MRFLFPYLSTIGPFSKLTVLGGTLTNIVGTTGNLVMNTKVKAYEPSLMPTDVVKELNKPKDSLLKIGLEGARE